MESLGCSAVTSWISFVANNHAYSYDAAAQTLLWVYGDTSNPVTRPPTIVRENAYVSMKQADGHKRKYELV